MLEDMLRPGLSDEEHLSNLCTLLVIAEGMDIFPIETIAEFLVSAVDRVNENNSGDKAVLVARAVSLLLEKFPRRLGSVHGTIVPLLNAIMGWCRLMHEDTQGSTNKETSHSATAGSESAPAPLPAPAPASGGGARSKGRGKRPGHQQSTGGGSTSRSATTTTTTAPANTMTSTPVLLLFESSSLAELAEELLHCMQLLHGNDRLRHTLPSSELRLAVCKTILAAAAPLSPSSRGPLSYIAKVVRSGGISEQLLQECAMISANHMDYLAEHCDFTPHWDESLCSVTFLVVALVWHHSTPASLKSAVTSSCLALARKAWAKRPASRRWNLVAACVATSVGPSITIEELTREENWEWIRGVIEQGVNCNVARRIGNPFCSNEGKGGIGGSSGASPRPSAANDDDDGELTIPNTQWIPEDARVLCLWLVCRALHPAFADANVHFRYLVAWRDDHEQFRRYSTQVAESIVHGFRNSHLPRMGLPAVSSHHSVLFGPLTQLNEYTGVQRAIFLQPVPTTGTVVHPLPGSDDIAIVPRTSLSASSLSVARHAQLRQLLPTLMRLWSSPQDLETLGLATAGLSGILMQLIATSHFAESDETEYILPVLEHVADAYAGFPLMNVDAFVANLLSEPAASANWGRVLAKSKLFTVLQAQAQADESSRTVSATVPSAAAESSAHGKRTLSRREEKRAKKKPRAESPASVEMQQTTTMRALEETTTNPEQPSARSIVQRILASCRAAINEVPPPPPPSEQAEVAESAAQQGGAQGGLTATEVNPATLCLDVHHVPDPRAHLVSWVNSTPDIPRGGQTLSEFVNLHQHALTDECLAVLHPAMECQLRALAPKEKKELTFNMCARTTKVNICQRSRGPSVCPNVPSHGPLRLHHSAGWICNECGRRSSFASLSCRECDYDLCQHCALLKNPLSIDVSNCATVGDILKHLAATSRENVMPAFTASVSGRSFEAHHLGRTWFTAAHDMFHSSRTGSPQPDLLCHSVLSCTTTPSGALSPATTVHSLPLGSRKRRNEMFGLHIPATNASAVHHHSPVELHLLNDESVGLCACHHTAHQSPLLASAHPTPDLVPMDIVGSPKHSSRKISHPSAGLQGVPLRSSPDPMSIPAALGGAPRSSRRGGGNLLSEVEAMELAVPPSEGIGRAVVEVAEGSAVDVFLNGLLGLPLELRALLQSRQRACVPLAVRKDLMRFCAAECRRHALAHMVAAGFRTRGTVSVDLRSAPVCTKCITKRGDLARIVADLDRVFSTLPSLRSKVEFALEGEEGTGEGPTQEVYAEVSHLVTAETQLWFRQDNDDAAAGAGVRILFPCQEASSSLNPSVFRVLGACFARSFVDGFTMDLSLSPLLWECVVAARTASDVELLHFVASRLDPLLHKNVVSLLQLDGTALAELGLFMEHFSTTTATSSSSPEAIAEDNVSAYVERTLRRRFSDCCTSVRCFLAGFATVADPGILSMIAPDEADVVFCGRRVDGTDGHLFTEAELRAHTVGAHGYSLDSAEVQNLLRIAASLSPLQQSHFVEFLTGTPRLPLGGLAGLNRPITVAKKDLDYGDQTLPSCNTCFLYFKLPPYRSAELMRERLLVAITEGRKNFSLS